MYIWTRETHSIMTVDCCQLMNRIKKLYWQLFLIDICMSDTFQLHIHIFVAVCLYTHTHTHEYKTEQIAQKRKIQFSSKLKCKHWNICRVWLSGHEHFRCDCFWKMCSEGIGQSRVIGRQQLCVCVSELCQWCWNPMDFLSHAKMLNCLFDLTLLFVKFDLCDFLVSHSQRYFYRHICMMHFVGGNM